jgi:hypothetical protein
MHDDDTRTVGEVLAEMVAVLALGVGIVVGLWVLGILIQ